MQHVTKIYNILTGGVTYLSEFSVDGQSSLPVGLFAFQTRA